MQSRYSGIQWVVQRNVTHSTDLEKLKQSCETRGIYFQGIEVIPFSTTLPDFDVSRKSIFYGSTTFNKLIAEEEKLRSGLFFDSEKFSISNYFRHWGRHMLNYGAEVTTFKELMSRDEDPKKLLFVRPDDDSKSFSGETRSFGEIAEWYEQLKTIENSGLSLDSPIVVSSPWQIRYEWRLWMVAGRVVTASKYRTDFRLTKERGCPAEVAAFAEARCREYQPHEVFVMDVCLCGDELFIVECGCMNAAGFYQADIDVIVLSVSDWYADNFS
ncbi:ATP-grasp domain-containing protein [Chitinophaga sp. 212800010-3]|uniref:ATP-grasp domain-containing protein n=1 Tax=unclassified Chitinophaga TaxID=2619133 RepID=UPI002DEF2C53|nr:R2K-3 domain-containing protein [Chitinophaga sp. 212800010-3]